jgi:hypothetical protein
MGTPVNPIDTVPSALLEIDERVETAGKERDCTRMHTILSVLLKKGETVELGQERYYPRINAILEQQTNGQLVLRIVEQVIWSNGFFSNQGRYYSILLADGHFLTRNESSGQVVWKTGVSGDVRDGVFFLALNTDDTLSVYKDEDQVNPSVEIWSRITQPVKYPIPTVLAVLLEKDEKVEIGQEQSYPEINAILEQQNNGRLVLRIGEEVIWSNGFSSTPGRYYSMLQADGNFLTRNETSGEVVWTTGVAGDVIDGPYFLAVNVDDTISVYTLEPRST